MPEIIDINSQDYPIFSSYFHAVSLNEDDNIFDKSKHSSLEVDPNNEFVIDKIITPLTTSNFLKKEGNDLLIPMKGLLVVPDEPINAKYPLVVIGHGNAISFFDLTGTPNDPIAVRSDEVLSYKGYQVLQNYLAENNIASYSINLNFVNTFFQAPFDFYQRIQIFFLHLLMLKIIAAEPHSAPDTNSADYPFKFFDGGASEKLGEILTSSLTTAAVQRLKGLRTIIQDKIDFTNLGLMGHSRGADAVSRMFNYFSDGATVQGATIPINDKLDERIKDTVGWLNNPLQEHIKCILALEPVDLAFETDGSGNAVVDAINSLVPVPQFEINSETTFYLAVAGTHDEDVTSDAIRIYEYPNCPKAMYFIHGATHVRFNSIWRKLPIQPAGTPDINDTIGRQSVVRIISNSGHDKISRKVFGNAFIATMKDVPLNFLYFTHDKRIPIDLRLDLHRAWRFSYPIDEDIFPVISIKSLDDKFVNPLLNKGGGALEVVEKKQLRGVNTNLQDFRPPSVDFNFEQTIEAFYIIKENSKIFSIQIPIDPSTDEKLSLYTHFSFRFAKGYDVTNDNYIPDLKNFTIRLFKDNSPESRLVRGNSRLIKSVIQRAYPTRLFFGSQFTTRTAIVLQTVEIRLDRLISDSVKLGQVNKIVIELIKGNDKTKSNTDEDVFVFKDFLLTFRDIEFFLPPA